jgi:S1-C subfamily serine protease
MNKRWIPLICLAVLIVLACGRLAAEQNILSSVIKVYAESYPFNYQSPWTLDSPLSVTGSGSIIDGGRILTSAHVVADAKFIQVKRAGGEEKYVAEVEIIAHECDLALLRVKDKTFFEGISPLAIGALVNLRDRVTVYGFPSGGEELSTTEGIVSRIEIRGYTHSRNWLLCGQIDAAINPGSSGGPVIKDGRIVGIAFQAGRGQNISYMVPAPVIDHFLRDIKDGTYNGIPSLEITWQEIENADMRSKLQLKAGQSGVLVTAVRPGSPVEGRVERGDVILSIDGRRIAGDGTVEFRENERTLYYFYIQEHFIGDTLDLEVLRDGRVLKLPIKLTVPINATLLVPNFQYDVQPSYFIIGGLVFQRLTGNYITMFGERGSPAYLQSFAFYDEPTPDRKNIVVLTGVLADEMNMGYESLTETVVFKANGRNVASLPDLVEAVETNTGPFHVFVDFTGREIVIDRAKAKERGALILKRYKIDADRSDDLKTKAKAKGGAAGASSPAR